MKKALVVLLVLVAVVTGLPLVLGMSAMPSCHDCDPATPVGAGCTMAILAGGVALIFALLVRRLRSRGEVMPFLFHSFLLERPPRLA
ncbi:MAG: hypothetical protein ACR2HV_04885 [Acidimicrobiales bacterium]